MKYLLKRWVERVKKSDLYGWKNVFAFTFTQHYKSKAAKITLILISLFIIFIGPVLSVGGGKGAEQLISKLSECEIEKMYVRNQTDYIFDGELFKKENEFYKKVEFIETDATLDKLEADFRENSDNDLILDISFDKAENKYKMVLYKSGQSAIDSTVTDLLSESASTFFYNSRIKQLGIDEAANDIIDTEISVKAIDISDIADNSDNSDEANMIMMTIVIFYSVIIMFIVIMSSQQIATSIIIEKTSKVVETIMISIKPLALIVGKILGTMCILVCDFVVIILSGFVSLVLSTIVAAKKMPEILQSFGDKLSQVNTGGTATYDVSLPDMDISPERILLGIFIIFLTTIMAYLFYSVLAGISGASCGSMDDLQSASSVTVLTSLAGMYISMFVPLVNNDAFTAFAKIFPFSGMYIVPVYFIFAKASIWNVLLIWAEMSVLTVFLFKFSARIYHVLIFHKGERLKIGNLIGLSKSQKGKVR